MGVGYDSAQCLSSVALPGFATNYAYDTLGRLDTVTSPSGIFDYGYVGATGKLSQLALPNGATTNYGYDALDRLTQIESLSSTNANISRYTYGYDNVTHRVGRTSEVSQIEAEDPITRAYGYDDVDQVTSEVLSQAGVTLQETSYGFDPMGNRTQVQSTSTAGQSTSSYSHNRVNQTTSLSTTTAQGASQSTLSYDDEGNLSHVGATAQSGTFYSYDDANQLSQIVNRDAAGEPTSKSTFLYDGFKRLRVSREFSWQNGVWVQTSEVRRVYSSMNVVQERDAQNNVLATYTRGSDMGGGISGLLARSDDNGSLFYHYDGRGNVTQLTDTTQQIVAKYGYDAFGNTSATGAAAGLNRYRFLTKEQMGGLYYYGYRFYSPGLGRLVNRDANMENKGTNLYSMFGNNPVDGIYPYSLVKFDLKDRVKKEFSTGWFVNINCDLANGPYRYLPEGGWGAENPIYNKLPLPTQDNGRTAIPSDGIAGPGYFIKIPGLYILYMICDCNGNVFYSLVPATKRGKGMGSKPDALDKFPSTPPLTPPFPPKLGPPRKGDPVVY